VIEIGPNLASVLELIGIGLFIWFFVRIFM
jgi:hypothetical protein